jgi:hypothetical protein
LTLLVQEWSPTVWRVRVAAQYDSQRALTTSIATEDWEESCMADLKLAPGFEEALRARLQSPEGQDALTQFAALIARRVVETFPPELLDTLETAEGRKAFEEAWPSIVDAYFQSLCAPRPKKRP